MKGDCQLREWCDPNHFDAMLDEEWGHRPIKESEMWHTGGVMATYMSRLFEEEQLEICITCLYCALIRRGDAEAQAAAAVLELVNSAAWGGSRL